MNPTSLDKNTTVIKQLDMSSSAKTGPKGSIE